MLKRSFWFTLLFIFTLMPIAHAQEPDLSSISCAVFPDQLAGQAYVGFAGAAYVGFAGAGGDAIQDANLDLDAEAIVSEWQYSESGDNAVAILIVDDFSSDEPEDPEDWETASHGWLVQEVFDQLYAELPEAVAENIQFETIDVFASDFRSDLIQENIADTIETLTEDGVERFVVNMSFVFVNCEDGDFNFLSFLEHRADDPEHTLIAEMGNSEDEVRDFLADEENERIDPERGPGRDVVQRLTFLRLFENNELNNDPLRDYFRDSSEQVIVPVASSGNFKWTRPFFPARWPEVISVSALAGESGDLWGLSNNGEVSAPGAYMLFPDEAFRAGTSFAAPVVSLMIALDLTQDSPSCERQGTAPELSSNGRFDDLPLIDAANERC